jgi:hypothetical protein
VVERNSTLLMITFIFDRIFFYYHLTEHLSLGVVNLSRLLGIRTRMGISLPRFTTVSILAFQSFLKRICEHNISTYSHEFCKVWNGSDLKGDGITDEAAMVITIITTRKK